MVSRWQDRATCRGVLDGRWDAREMSACAGRLCLECPVRLECVSEALDRHHTEDVGIWGGTTPKQRDRIRRRRLTLDRAWRETAEIVEAGDRILFDVDEFVAEIGVEDGGGGEAPRRPC